MKRARPDRANTEDTLRMLTFLRCRKDFNWTVERIANNCGVERHRVGKLLSQALKTKNPRLVRVSRGVYKYKAV